MGQSRDAGLFYCMLIEYLYHLCYFQTGIISGKPLVLTVQCLQRKQMKETMKQVIKMAPFYYPLRYWLKRKREKKRQAKELREWEEKGMPVLLPHIIKQRVLRKFAEEYGLKILVETGTYYGEMVEAMKDCFSKIYSIELSKELYEDARERFRSAKHIELIHGDSGKELKKLMQKIDKPALFWLDGHYSAGVTARGEKDTPIYEELHCILNAQNLGHVIIIDDARDFGNDPAYPSLEELKEFIRSKNKDVSIAVQDDSIRIIPKAS